MTISALAVLNPLMAAAAILLIRRGASVFAVAGAGLGLAAAVYALSEVAGGARLSATLPGLPDFPLMLVATPLTATLSTLVAVVSFFVIVYAVGYMKGEPDKVHFFAGMSFFVAAMQTLVLAGDWVLLLASWELIGLASYLLIGFWHERPEARRAATRAFLYTRTADLGLYAAIFILVTQTGTTEIERTFTVGGAAALVAGLFLLLAAAGKSAQTPFSGWLSDAMAGPTPVSALLHSATLVAAGAILLIRAFPLFPPDALLVVGLVGGATAIAAGLTAISEPDLKRLLAASTSAQYGFMLLAVGAGSPAAATVHLAAHAAMKSSLFLGAGIFQRARGSTAFDDLGGAGRERKWTFLAFAIAGLALAGIPPLSGFFSKDAVLAASFDSPYALLLGPLALLATLLTGIYVGRALALLWDGKGENAPVGGSPVGGSPVGGVGWMGAGLAALVVLAVVIGSAMAPLARFLGTELPEGLLVAALGLSVGVAGLAAGWLVDGERLLGEPLRDFAATGFRVGGGFDGLVARPAMAFAKVLDALDRGIHAGARSVGAAALSVANLSRFADERGIDGFIAFLVHGARKLGGRARALQSGLVHKELLLAVAGIAVILALLAISP
ncbi:MAG: NADH-quinone oxidoreductase subunit L [Actinomycetota bacterium]|nr:NADH-quinone oxidoreductase subunit L [Rubrobacter sp.]MDQ3509017.1 NADH-quinone oxidoreductase subunit L [Actinomycetota bacterium]